MTRPLVLLAAVAMAVPVVAQPKDGAGYWQLVEVVPVEYPVEKVHKLYPVVLTRAGTQLTAVAKALNGNDPKIVHTEELQVWTWTAPPRVLVPGENVPVRFALKLDRPRQTKPPEFYIGGRMNAGFLPPRPAGAEVYHVGNDARTADGGTGWLDPRDKHQGGDRFAPGTYTRDAFVVVPARRNPYTSKDHPDQISFRVGGAIGNTREFNTIYEYRWVDGVPPTDRGGPGQPPPAPAPPAAPAPAPPVAGGQWEYMLSEFVDRDLTRRLEGRLNDLGRDGWELAGVIPPTREASGVLFLKRPRR